MSSSDFESGRILYFVGGVPTGKEPIGLVTPKMILTADLNAGIVGS